MPSFKMEVLITVDVHYPVEPEDFTVSLYDQELDDARLSKDFKIDFNEACLTDAEDRKRGDLERKAEEEAERRMWL